MKILAISHLFPTLSEKRNGIFTSRQLEAMAKLDEDIHVIVPQVWCPAVLRRFKRWQSYNHRTELCEFDNLVAVGVPYFRLPGNGYNRWSGLAVFRAIRNRVVELHKKHNFDIIYATDFFPDADAAVRLKKILGIPVAYLAIGVDINYTAYSTKTVYRHFEKTVSQIDGLLACGQGVADKLEDETGKKPLCVYGVVDLNEFKPVHDKGTFRKLLKLPSAKTIILYAGYLQERKGIFELIEAFDSLERKNPDAVLVMCGHGDKQEEFKEQISERGLNDKVIMAGDVDPSAMHQWMKASDIFVLPSYSEGMPNVVMEAMACGVPVVATRVGGIPNALKNCDGAFLVETHDAADLEKAIEKVLANPHLRERMELSARLKAETDFGVHKNARRILEYLEAVREQSIE